MRHLIFVLGDQLSVDISSLDGFDPAQDAILMAEVHEEANYVPHHAAKLVMIFAAMRHHAALLRTRGFRVTYVQLDEEANPRSFSAALQHAVEHERPQRIVLTEPGEWRVEHMMRGFEALCGVPVEIRPDRRFLCSREEFAHWAQHRKTLRMELFYRDMRRKTGWLMEGEAPLGGQWNFDVENRQALPPKFQAPDVPDAPDDEIRREVTSMVHRLFPHQFGRTNGFRFAITRAQALARLEHFITYSLPQFGTYQDAMQRGAPFLHHALVAAAMNIGLLSPREVCLAALDAGEHGHAPLNAVEGFVRQILGWREYVRGIYWLKMPHYAASNHFNAHRPLPEFFWTGETEMACVSEVVRSTRDHAYAHHIQRLMITGNFALLAGLDPGDVEAWYLAVYADAFEWVELPNTHGMALFADGGLLASKPYAASGAYIDRMSDYCKSCAYSVKLKAGPKACPFNYLYWDFLLRHRQQLAKNPRLVMPYRNLARFDEARIAGIQSDARQFLNSVAPNLLPASEKPVRQ